MLDAEMVGEGVIGNTGDEGTRTGKVVIELVLESVRVNTHDMSASSILDALIRSLREYFHYS